MSGSNMFESLIKSLKYVLCDSFNNGWTYKFVYSSEPPIVVLIVNVLSTELNPNLSCALTVKV